MNGFGLLLRESWSHSFDVGKKSTSLNFLPLPFEKTSIGWNTNEKLFETAQPLLKERVAMIFLKERPAFVPSSIHTLMFLTPVKT